MLPNRALHPPLATSLHVKRGRAGGTCPLEHFLPEKLRFALVFSKARSSWHSSWGLSKIFLCTRSYLIGEECRLLEFIVIYNVGQLRGYIQNGTLRSSYLVTYRGKKSLFICTAHYEMPAFHLNSGQNQKLQS